MTKRLRTQRAARREALARIEAGRRLAKRLDAAEEGTPKRDALHRPTRLPALLRTRQRAVWGAS